MIDVPVDQDYLLSVASLQKLTTACQLWNKLKNFEYFIIFLISFVCKSAN